MTIVQIWGPGLILNFMVFDLLKAQRWNGPYFFLTRVFFTQRKFHHFWPEFQIKETEALKAKVVPFPSNEWIILY